jgi:hypothetical protein
MDARPGGHRAPTPLPILIALLLGGCGHTGRGADGARRQTLEGLLRAEHASLVARDPGAVSEQLARMARSSFAYFRGSLGLLPEEPSGFVTPASARIAIVGDAHPENIGTYRTPRGERVVDFNDFDRAGHGPYVRDLRRLALGLWLAADMADLGRRPRARTVEEMCAGYLAELQALARGGPPIALRVETAFGGDLLAVLTEPDPTDLSPQTAATPEERGLVEAALRDYPATLVAAGAASPAAFALKEVARVSAGIASLRLLRFRARVEGPTPAPADDWVLELKESEPRSAPAERLVQLQREIQEFPDDDPLLGWGRAGDRTFRVRGAGPDQRRLSVERISKRVRSPSWGKKDLRELAFQCGRLLARGHARARAADGAPGLAAVVAAVGDGRGLTRETIAVTARAARAIEADRDHLRALLAEKGPLLGWASAPPAARAGSGSAAPASD